MPGLTLLIQDRNPDAIAEIVHRLEKAGVPYVLESGTALTILGREDASLEAPELWEGRVWITAEVHDRAARILAGVVEKFGLNPLKALSSLAAAE